MKILVTGANGFVGSALCTELIKRDITVLGAIREKSYATGLKSMLVGDINNTTNWMDCLLGVDIVIHLAARVHIMKDQVKNPLAEFRKTNVEATLNLAKQAHQAGVKRFIYMSSIKVNGEVTKLGQPFNTSDQPCPQDAYAISKFEAEQGLLDLAKETGMEVVIIRPPLIYGAGVKANFASMVRAVKCGIPLPLGAISNKRSFVYVGNLVSLIIKCIEHPAAANQTFLVSDGRDLSTTELLKACAIALNVKPRLIPVPKILIELAAGLVGKRGLSQRLCGNLQVDISQARELLDWEPPFSVEEGLKATIDCI